MKMAKAKGKQGARKAGRGGKPNAGSVKERRACSWWVEVVRIKVRPPVAACCFSWILGKTCCAQYWFNAWDESKVSTLACKAPSTHYSPTNGQGSNVTFQLVYTSWPQSVLFVPTPFCANSPNEPRMRRLWLRTLDSGRCFASTITELSISSGAFFLPESH